MLAGSQWQVSCVAFLTCSVYHTKLKKSLKKYPNNMESQAPVGLRNMDCFRPKYLCNLSDSSMLEQTFTFIVHLLHVHIFVHLLWALQKLKVFGAHKKEHVLDCQWMRHIGRWLLTFDINDRWLIIFVLLFI